MNQILKDRYGVKIGEIRDEGSRKTVYDKYGVRLGYYDGRYTYDKYGVRVGEGDLLAALLPRF